MERALIVFTFIVVALFIVAALYFCSVVTFASAVASCVGIGLFGIGIMMGFIDSK